MTVMFVIAILVAAGAYWFFTRSDAGETREILLQADYIMNEGESPDIAYERVYYQARQKANDMLVSFIMRQLTEQRRLSLGNRIVFVAAGCSDILVLENKKDKTAKGTRYQTTVRAVPVAQRVQKLIRMAEDFAIVREFDSLQNEFKQNWQDLEILKERSGYFTETAEQQAGDIRRNELYFQKLLLWERIFWLRQMQQPETVIQTCDRLLELDEQNWTAYTERGRAYIRLKLYDEAQNDFDKAAALAEDQTVVWLARAELFEEKGQFEEAYVELTKIVEHAPHTPLAFLRRGEICEKMKQYSQAIEDYSEILKLEPDNIMAYIKRALVREMKGQASEALDDFAAALARDPYNLNVLNNRARLLENQGQPEEALADLNQAILIEPEDPVSYNNRGNLHYNDGQFDLAVTDFNKAILFQPGDADGYFNKARALEKRGDMAQAVEAYKLFLRYTPTDDPIAGMVHEKLKVLLR